VVLLGLGLLVRVLVFLRLVVLLPQEHVRVLSVVLVPQLGKEPVPLLLPVLHLFPNLL
jgi:hypothetical protein